MDRPPCSSEPVLSSHRRLRVPVASDGTKFLPSLKRAGVYRIGAKGAEQVVETFEEALRILEKMNPPLWRRPNPQGNWGIVRGVAWEDIVTGDDE
ncbi:MAG TPA: hypothetical protein VHC20_03340 [Candidatus Paceibacterota bacterium]|nr:hypothetical protein [Candidatus Paceibacterota bacterium]